MKGLKTRTVADFPDVAAEWHPEKNSVVSPQDVGAGFMKKVWWKCPVAEDHEWQATPERRLNKHTGCPYCAGTKVVLSNCLATTHPALAAEWHPSKNGSLTPYDLTAGSDRTVWWKCPVADDHEWKVAVSNRAIRHAGCACCAGRKAVLSNCLATTHPSLAAEWHPTKNGNLTPYDIVARSAKRVWWRCPRVDGHVWEVAPSDRVKASTGCPKCNLSKGEKAIREYLVRRQIPHKAQWGQRRAGLPRRYAFDFAVNRQDAFWLIEYHGKQHYCPAAFGSKKKWAKYQRFIDVIRRDEIKKRWCHDRQKNLFVIPYWEFDRVEAILGEFFNDHEPVIVKKYKPMRQKIVEAIAEKNKLLRF